MDKRPAAHRKGVMAEKFCHPNKRLARQREEKTVNEEVASLDHLPSEAIRNIVRWMGNRPGSENWMEYLTFKDVEKLYLGNGYASEQCR